MRHFRRRHHRALVFVAIVAVAVLEATPAWSSGIVPPHNPATNLNPVPAYGIKNGVSYTVGAPLPACWHWHASNFAANPTSSTCEADELAATNRAHRLEKIPALRLPRNFNALSAPEQLLVLVDLERVSRGEAPVLGLSSALDAPAQRAARVNADPSLPSPSPIANTTGGWAANWAQGISPLDANYNWMYNDGWGGTATYNLDCTSAHAPGCWGHRDNILVNNATLPCYEASCTLVMGAAKVAGATYNSYTELLVQLDGPPPALLYTWSAALKAGARA